MFKMKKMFVMLSLGFASGLPYILIISTSTAWLRDVGIDLSYIGSVSYTHLTLPTSYAV